MKLRVTTIICSVFSMKPRLNLDGVKILGYNIDIAIPTLIIHTKKDELVSNKSLNLFYKNLKNDLIEKGIELVNKNGINQLSLRKVAQACGVSHAAPYSHFSNKEELLQEMQLHITKKFTEVLENTVSQYRGTPIFLLEFGKAYISFFISHPQYFNFLFQQGNIQIDLNIDSGRESNYQPFAIYKEQVLKLLADTNMTQSKKEDLIIALFAYVQGLTTLATMENVHYAYKWEDKLTDLIGIFSCEF